MDLSIIIISYNTKDLLSLCLTSLYRSLSRPNFSFEVIVVDNASQDGSAATIQNKFGEALLIQNKKNVGFGKANNQAIRKSRGEYILLLNSDTKIEDQAIQKLYAFSKAHRDCFVGPKLLNPDGTSQTSCGPFFSLPVVFASLFLKGDVLGLTRWSPDRIQKVDWVSGACLLAPRKVFAEGLLFDERIFMYMDEIDLLYRAKSKGYNTFFLPDSRVIHVGSGSSTDKRKGPITNIFRGLPLLYASHYPGWQKGILKGMLQCKAFLGIWIGRISGNKELTDTYEEALRLVQ